MEDYEAMRAEIEEQIAQCQKDAQIEYETDKQSFSQQKHTEPEQKDDSAYETRYLEAMKDKTPYDVAVKEYNENRRQYKESKQKLEASCERHFQHLVDTKQWKQLNYQTFSGHVAYYEPVTHSIWIVDLYTFKHGAKRPQKELYDELKQQVDDPELDYSKQPYGFRFIPHPETIETEPISYEVV